MKALTPLRRIKQGFSSVARRAPRPGQSLDYVKFMIFSPGRSGSTMLSRWLDNHPNAVCDGELINPARLESRGFTEKLAKKSNDDAADFLIRDWRSSVWHHQPRRVGAAGFKTIWGHYVDRQDVISSAFARFPELRFIVLDRRNRLERLLSHLQVGLSGVHNVSDVTERPEQPDINVDIDYAGKYFRESDVCELHLDACAAPFPNIKIYYEDLVGDRASAMEVVSDFLSIPTAVAQDKTVKLATRTPMERIANYDELRRAFRGTAWAWFFDDVEANGSSRAGA